jgi:hypothetical protein
MTFGFGYNRDILIKQPCTFAGIDCYFGFRKWAQQSSYCVGARVLSRGMDPNSIDDTQLLLH